MVFPIHMPSHENFSLYLASKSPRRRELLGQAGIRFQVYIPQKSELLAPKNTQKSSPSQIVKRISLGKALACADEIKNKNCLILSADTLVFQNKKVLGQPKSKAHAKKMLRALGGKWHEVFTGVTLLKVKNGKIIQKKNISVRTRVKFFPLSKKKIDWYISTGEPMDKAGSYGAQGYGVAFIEKFIGSYTNVVGLPLGETISLLESFTGRAFYE